METFPLFTKLPVDLRRYIWCMTVRPATIHLSREPLPDDAYPKLGTYSSIEAREATNYALRIREDQSPAQYRVLAVPSLLACREAYEFLHFFFPPLQRLETLPSWFQFNIDTIRCGSHCLPQLSRFSWCSSIETLVVDNVHECAEIFQDPRDGTPIKYNYIAQHFASLRHLTLELEHKHVEKKANDNHWLADSWMWYMEDLYNRDSGRPPVPFYVHVVSPSYPREEWLTPTNYLRVGHEWQKKRNVYLNETREEWESEIVLDPTVQHHAIAESDDDLDDPAAWFAKRRPFRY